MRAVKKFIGLNMRDGRKNIKQYIKELERDGWTVEVNGHIKVRSPEGQLFTCSSSPKGPYAVEQLKRDIRRYRRVKYSDLDRQTLKMK